MKSPSLSVSDSSSVARIKKSVLISRRPRTNELSLISDLSAVDSRSIDYSSNIRLNPDGKISGILGDIKSFAEIDKSLGSPVLSPLFASKIEFAESSDEKYAYRHNQGACVHADEYTCFSGSQKTDILERKQYFSQIEDAKEMSNHIREIGCAHISRIGPMDQLRLQKEQRIMRKWKEQEGDWDAIKANLSSIIGRTPDSLNMSTIDDFRLRNEAYQLLQAAKPPKDRMPSEDFWEMSLRDLGEYKIPVGGKFSGLSFVKKWELIPLKTVRRPIETFSTQELKKTWRDSDAFKSQQQKLAKKIAKIGPPQKDLDPEGAFKLLIKGVPLLEWAEKSSLEHFSRVDKEENDRNISAQNRIVFDLPKKENSTEENVGPCLELHASRHCYMEMNVSSNNAALSSCTLENKGSTVIFYRWSRSQFGDIWDSNNNAIPPNTEVFSNFSCDSLNGMLLPGQKHTVQFIFHAKKAGLYSDSWRLTTLPCAHIAFIDVQANENAQYKNSENSKFEKTQGSEESGLHDCSNMKNEYAVINLTGNALYEDTTKHMQARIEAKVDRGVMEAKIEEVVREIIKGVRTPPRQSTLRACQEALFTSSNPELSSAYHPFLFDACLALFREAQMLYRQLSEETVTIESISAVESNQEDMHTDYSTDVPLPLSKVVDMLQSLESCEWDGNMDSIMHEINKLLTLTTKEKCDIQTDSMILALETEELENKEETEDDTKVLTQKNTKEKYYQLIESVHFNLKRRWKELQLRVDVPTRSLFGSIDEVCSKFSENFAENIAEGCILAQKTLAFPLKYQPPNGALLGLKFTPEHCTAWAIVDNAPGQDPQSKALALSKGKSANFLAASRVLMCAGVKEALFKAIDTFECFREIESEKVRMKEAKNKYGRKFLDISGIRSLDVSDKKVVVLASCDGNREVEQLANEIFRILSFKPKCISVICEKSQPASELSSFFQELFLSKGVASVASHYQTVIDLADSIGQIESHEIIPVFFCGPIQGGNIFPEPNIVPDVPSDDEEERLPDFLWGQIPKQESPKKLPCIDIFDVLKQHTDTFVVQHENYLIDSLYSFPKQKEQFQAPLLVGSDLKYNLSAISEVIGVEVPRYGPLLVIIGGYKAESKLRLIDSLLYTCHEIALVGGVGLSALVSIGKKLKSYDSSSVISVLGQLLSKARSFGVNVILPIDLVLGNVPIKSAYSEMSEEDFDNLHEPSEYKGETTDLLVDEEISAETYAFDIGPLTVEAIQKAIERSERVIWHGMMGVAECSAFQSGTRDVLEHCANVVSEEYKPLDGLQRCQIVLCGKSLEIWASKIFKCDNPDQELGSEVDVFVCTYSKICTKILEGKSIQENKLDTLLRRLPLADKRSEESLR